MFSGNLLDLMVTSFAPSFFSIFSRIVDSILAVRF